LRQRILYADHIWRQQRFFAFFLLFAGPVAAVYLYLTQGHRFTQTVEIFLLYVPAGLLLVGALQYYRFRSHVHAREDGLKVSNLFSSVVIPYEEIRAVRVQPLRAHFPDRRKRYIAPAMRPQLDKPALFIRVRSEEMAAYVRSKLGARLAFEDTIALPVADPDKAAWHVNGRLPEKMSTNLGGGRRKKRRR
jgi:hypothetical protein